MKEIELTNGNTTIVDDKDYDIISQFKWYVNLVGYVIRTTDAMRLHRFLMNAKKNQMIDHKDRNKLNNQKENLRFCTASENQKNKKSIGKSKYLGVYLQISKKRSITKKYGERVYIYSGWATHIVANGKYIYLGYFKDEITAAKKYDEAAIKYHGEFANLNFKTTII